MFENITQWKLKKGSHDFPGPDGGTCVNEAAIVAAGFEYKKISSAHDCPPCFSRPIAAYAIKLNDSMPDDLRQELLMPFVTRLAGTADTREVEALRVKFMAIEMVKRILSLTCERRLKRSDLAEKCRNVKTLKEAGDVSREVRAAYAAAAAADAAAADAAAAYAADAAAAYAAYAAAAAAYAAADAAADAAAAAAAYAAYAAAAADADADADAYAADAAAYAAADAAADAADAAAAYAKKEIFIIACEILNDTIMLGKHTEVEAQEASPRLEKAKREKISA